MALFLFTKQIVDMLYQYRILDYIMVIWVILLLAYQTLLVRPDIRRNITFADIIILTLGILVTINYVRTQSGYQIYFKVMSALLMYFVGRVYYERIQECYGALVTASYLIVYISLGERIYRFGLLALCKIQNAGGGFYFYDTDMAFAMILAMIFIAMYAKNSLFKLLTIFVVCPYMVFFSDAGIQMALLIAVYMVIAIYILELILRNRKISGALLTIMVGGMLLAIAYLYAPVIGVMDQKNIEGVFSYPFFDLGNMYSRYGEWRQILYKCAQGSWFRHIFGTDMGADVVIRSLYIKIFYATGYCGLLLTLLAIMNVMYYVVKIEDRKTFYLAVIMAILLLGSGVSVNSMESTQMSWFPMMFSGMVISSVQAQRRKILGIVTGTICPSTHMGQLVLRNEKERLEQYLSALRTLIESGAFSKIIFAENSNYGCNGEQFNILQQSAIEHQTELEFLSFQGDAEQACIHGKGYGEGEIMKYVFQNSELMKEESYFVKMTGRLQIDNIDGIVTNLKKTGTYFNIPNSTRRDIYDTRIYAMPIKQFEEFFMDEYVHVMDSEGIYLEHVYTEILCKNRIHVSNFPKYPRIKGISGSGGIIYDYTEWKCKIKDLLCKINYYKVNI